MHILATIRHLSARAARLRHKLKSIAYLLRSSEWIVCTPQYLHIESNLYECKKAVALLQDCIDRSMAEELAVQTALDIINNPE